MSERGSAIRRHLQRRAVRKLVAKLGAAKLAIALAAALAAFLGFLVLLALLAGASASGEGSEGQVSCRSGGGGASPPGRLVPIYAAAAARYRLGARGPGILAAINKVESDFGRSDEPGVHSGANYAGAEGPMQFLQGTWETYGLDGDGDGVANVYDPADAIFGAANLLRAEGAPGDWYGAIFSYNHADWYVREVERLASRFSGQIVCTPVATPSAGGSAALRQVLTLRSPREFKPLPASLWAGAGAPESVDARLWPDAVWLLETFHLRVTAAREAGHNTHGDGTAMDMVPEAGRSWDRTARAAAEALGWREGCAASGTAPVCPLAPAIQFVGYNGYPSHGDPAHAGENAHLHVSWQSSSFGSGALSPPPEWVRVFPLAS